jgi:hypothetical protein
MSSRTPLGSQLRSGGPEGAPDDAGRRLTEDEAFDILNNERRRQALRYLREEESATDLGTLCEHVASRENEIPPEQVGSDQRKRVYTALKQSHLPKMDRAGVIEFDDRDKNIELTDRAAELDIYLEIVPENRISWSSYYLGLAGVFGLLLAPVGAGMYPFDLLPDAGWMGLMTTLLLCSAVVHWYQTREMRLGGPSEGE